MTERNRAKRARSARSASADPSPDALAEAGARLEALERWNAERALKARGLPEAWDALAWAHPAEPAKLPMTLTLAPEVLAWYEALGPDYADRINAVLRLYMLGVQAREIATPEQFDWRGAER